MSPLPDGPARDPVGLVGVGLMGGAMAERLCAQGWPVRAFDVVPQRLQGVQVFGVQALASAREVAMNSEALVVCVVDAAQTEDVLFGPQGAAAALRPGQTVLLCPTIAPEDVERFAARLAERGVDTLDAPLSGGPARAREGRMSLMVAGADAVFEARRGLLETLGAPVFQVGTRPGDGARTKLVNNLLAGINLVGAAEALALAQRLGLNPATTLDVIERSSGQSWIGVDRLRRALAGDTAPRARMALLAKDTRLAQQAAQAAGFDGPLGPAAAAVFARALQAGLADEDDAALWRWLRG